MINANEANCKTLNLKISTKPNLRKLDKCSLWKANTKTITSILCINFKEHTTQTTKNCLDQKTNKLKENKINLSLFSAKKNEYVQVARNFYNITDFAFCLKILKMQMKTATGMWMCLALFFTSAFLVNCFCGSLKKAEKRLKLWYRN